MQRVKISGWLVIAPFFALVFGASPFANAGAFPETAYWSDRGDRKEGILRQQNVGGSTFSLLGVEIAGVKPLPGATPQVTAWIPAAAKPVADLKVHELRTNYAMKPNPGRVLAGVPFSWPVDDAIRPAKIPPARLRLLATDASGTYLPGLLCEGLEDRPTHPRYAFHFDTRYGLDLVWSVSKDNNGILHPVSEGSITQRSIGALRIEWDGNSMTGEAAPAGVYRLRLRPRPGTDPEWPVHFEIAFYHYGAVAW